MKKTLIIFAVIILSCSMFTACGKSISDEPEQDVDSEALIPFWEPEELDFDPPSALPQYSPEINAFPLINSLSIYTYLITGPLNFIDRQYNLLNIPKQATGYFECYSSGIQR